MSVKINRTGTPATQISIADALGLTLPDSDWAIAVGVLMNGDTGTASSAYQTIWRTGNSGEAGGMVAIWDPFSSGNSTAGKFYFQINGATNSRCVTPAIEAGKAYILALQRSGGAIVSKLAPILIAEPIDGAAVATSTAQASASGYDGSQGFIFGVHNVSSRRSDQSIFRAFFIKKALTDLQWAQLAFGKEITEFGTPEFYLRMNDVSDIVDSGPNAYPVLTQGALTTAPQPSFGYSSLPTAPVIAGKPVINGAPVVGTATTITPAPVTGNPSPHVTFRWTLNGADISDAAGGAGATYTPTANDAGKLLRVRQTASNGSGAPSATSDPVMVSSGAVGLTAIAIAAERIYQRSAGGVNGQAVIEMSGTYEGTAPAKIECQLYAPDGTTVVQSWFDTGATIASGSWSAAPVVPAPTNGKKYRRALRAKNSAGSVIFTTAVESTRFGIGAGLMCAGSSSVAAWFEDKSGTGIVVDQDVASTMDGNTGVWQNFGTDGRAGQMCEYISQRLGVPVFMINVARGGSSLYDWSNPNSELMTRFKTALTFAGGKLEGALFSAGSNDVTGASSAPTVQSHLDKLNSFRDTVREWTGQPDLLILLSGINRRLSALVPQVDNARTAENQFGDQPYCCHTQTLDFALSSDDVHLTGPGFVASCERNRYVWAEARLGTYRRGPELISMVYEGNRILDTVRHRNGSDISPASGITGFITVDDLGTPNLVSAVRLDATRILRTYDRALVNPKSTYLAGAAPEVGTPVYDNGAVPLPMTMSAYLLPVAGTISDGAGPTLTNATATTTGPTSANGSVSTNQVGGTLYRLTSPNASEPGSTVKASGTTSAVSASGAQNFVFTGLPSNTKLYAHYLHRNADGLDSAVLSSAQFQTTQAADTTAPLVGGAAVANSAPSVVALTASEPLDEAFQPAASAFTVGGHVVSSVTVQGGMVLLGVTSPFVAGESPREAAYVKPGSNGIRDLAGNLLESFSGLAVANFVTSTQPPTDTTKPSLPGQLGVSAVTHNSATLTCPTASDNVGVTGYEWSVDGGQSYPLTSTLPTKAVSGLPSATTVQAAVRAYDAAGNRSAALEKSFSTLAAPVNPDPEMSFTPSPSRTLTVSPTSKALAGGPWWNLATPSKPRGAKDPQATLDVTLNWGPWLADIGNPAIAKFTATIFGVTKVGAYAEGALTTMVFSGGTGTEATITFEIETATTPPLKDERTVYIDLVNQ